MRTFDIQERPIAEVPEEKPGPPISDLTRAVKALRPGSSFLVPLNGQTPRLVQGALAGRIHPANREDGGKRRTRYDRERDGVWAYWPEKSNA